MPESLAGTVTALGVLHRPDGTRTFLPGHTASLKHGARSPARVSARAAELLPEVEAMCEGMPAGSPAFAAARSLLATRLARLSLVTDWLAERGEVTVTDEGEPGAGVNYEQRCIREVERSLASLGLDVVSAARVGVDVVRARDLASSLRDLEASS